MAWRTSKIRAREKLIKVFSSVALIVAVAFVVRAAFLYSYFQFVVGRTFQGNEPFGYETGAIAAAIAQGRGFSSPLKTVQTGPTAWLTPIYPYLLAAIFKFFGVYSYTSHIVICFINNAFSAFTCWPLYSIGERAFSKRVGAAAAWSWVAFPMSLFFSTVWVWDTALSALMVTLIVAATLKMRGSKQLSSWAAYGALWAAGAMINASVVSLLLPLAIWAVLPLRREPFLATRVAAASIVFIIGITPWTVRNYVVFNKIIPFRSNFGLELWLGNNPLVPDLWSPTLHPNNSATEAAKYARITEIPYMQMKEDEAALFIRTHPIDVARFIRNRFADNWLGMWTSPFDLWSRVSLQARLGTIGNWAFPLLSLVGVLIAYRQRNAAAWPLVSVMLFFPLVFYVTHTSSRYSHPMHPIMLVLGVYAVGYLAAGLLRFFVNLRQGRMSANSFES